MARKSGSSSTSSRKRKLPRLRIVGFCILTGAAILMTQSCDLSQDVCRQVLAPLVRLLGSLSLG